jgi:putative DNA primase/helicase
LAQTLCRNGLAIWEIRDKGTLGFTITGSRPRDDGWLSVLGKDASGTDEKKSSAAINVGSDPKTRGRYKNQANGDSFSIFEAGAHFSNLGDWMAVRQHLADKLGMNVKLPSGNGRPKRKPKPRGASPPRTPQANGGWGSVRGVSVGVAAEGRPPPSPPPAVANGTPDGEAPKFADKSLEWAGSIKDAANLLAKAKPPVGVDAVLMCGGKSAMWPKTAPRRQWVIAFPAYDINGKVCRYCLVAPNGQQLQKYNGPNKPTSPGKVFTVGPAPGFLNPFALQRLAVAEVVWKVEGVTDLLALQTAIPDELLATHVVVTNSNGCVETVSQSYVAQLAGKKVYVVGDCDKPGQLGATKWCTALVSRAAEVKNVVLPYQIEDKHGKDVRDYFRAGRTYADLLKLAEAAAPTPPQASAAARPANGGAGNVGASSCGTGATSPEEDALAAAAREAGDDPHRLARLFLGLSRRDGLPLKRPPETRFYRDVFYRYAGGVYHGQEDSEFRAVLVKAVKAEFDKLAMEAEQEALEKADDDKPPPKAKMVTAYVVNNVRLAATSLCLVRSGVTAPAWIGDDEPPWPAGEILVAANGLIHLPTFAAGADREQYFRPHTPDLFSFNGLDYDFDPRAAEPAVFLGFLDDVCAHDPSMKLALQEWFGYMLLPDTSKQKIAMLIGPTRSGRGTIARVITRLIGKANVAGPTLSDLASHFGAGALMEKTLAVIGDCRVSPKDVAVAVENLLRISGEDLVTINRKFLPSLNAPLPTRLMILSNVLPRLPDSSGALAGRMLIFKFVKSWLGREDLTLEARIHKELPGILLWSVAGLKRLREQGHFTQTATGREMADELRGLGSPVQCFVNECLSVGPNETIAKSEAWSLWCKWCDRHGHRWGDTERLGRDLRSVVPGLGRSQPRDPLNPTKRIECYTGIGERKKEDEWEFGEE